jgi:hypothetical protein
MNSKQAKMKHEQAAGNRAKRNRASGLMKKIVNRKIKREGRQPNDSRG